MSSTEDPVTKLVVLISGNGTNLQALIDACGAEKLPSARIVRVICKNEAFPDF